MAYQLNLNCTHSPKPFIISMSKYNLRRLYYLIICASGKPTKIDNQWYEADKINLKQFKTGKSGANYVLTSSEVLIELDKLI